MSVILLAEDREDDIVLARRVIGKVAGGCEVVVARDGEETLAILGNHDRGHFKVVLLDIQMPKISGLEVLKRVRGDARLADQAVVMLTTSSSEADMAEARRLSADMYVIKPLGIKEFETRMKTVLEGFL